MTYKVIKDEDGYFITQGELSKGDELIEEFDELIEAELMLCRCINEDEDSSVSFDPDDEWLNECDRLHDLSSDIAMEIE